MPAAITWCRRKAAACERLPAKMPIKASSSTGPSGRHSSPATRARLESGRSQRYRLPSRNMARRLELSQIGVGAVNCHERGYKDHVSPGGARNRPHTQASLGMVLQQAFQKRDFRPPQPRDLAPHSGENISIAISAGMHGRKSAPWAGAGERRRSRSAARGDCRPSSHCSVMVESTHCSARQRPVLSHRRVRFRNRTA